LAEGDQDPPFRYSNTVTAVDAGERLRHQAGEDVEPVGQKIFELEQGRFGRRRGGLRRAVTHWTGVHHRPRPAVERWARASTAAANIGRRSPAAHRNATPVAGSVPRAGGYRSRDVAAPPQRRHSMATNSPRADVPVVVGTAPAISSRSILRNDPAST